MTFAIELAKNDADELRADHRVESVDIEGTPQHPTVVVTPTDEFAAGELESETNDYNTNVVVE